MARKKSSEDLDAELARLEAELAALEKGGAPPAPADEEPDLPRVKRLHGRPADAAPADAPALGATTELPPPPVAKRRFGWRRRGEASDTDEVAPPEHPAPSAPIPDEDLVPPRRAEPPRGPVPWTREGDAWLRTDTPPEEESRARGLLGRFRGREDAPETPAEAGAFEVVDEEATTARRRRTPVIVAVVILLLFALIAAVLAYDRLGPGGEIATSFAVVGPTDDSGAVLAATGRAVPFDASATAAETYRWDFGDASAPVEGSDPQVQHTYAAPGTYTVTLTATSGGASGTSSAIVRVIAAPVARLQATLAGAPVTERGPGENNVFVGDEVAFDALGSSADAATTLVEHRWDWESDGTTDATGARATHAFPSAGRHAVRLTVVDALGNEATATLNLHLALHEEASGTIGTGLPGQNPTVVDVPVRVERANNAFPVQVAFVLTWTPGAVAANSDLNLTILDGAGNPVAMAVPSGGATRIELAIDTPFLFSPGQWTARVARQDPTGVAGQPIGGADVPFTLSVDVVY